MNQQARSAPSQYAIAYPRLRLTIFSSTGSENSYQMKLNTTILANDIRLAQCVSTTGSE